MRALRNRTTDVVQQIERERGGDLDALMPHVAGRIGRRAYETGRFDEGVLSLGQSVASADAVEPLAAIVGRIEREAHTAAARLGRLIAPAILPIWLGNELLQQFVFDRDGNVNYMAHFAGLLSGALLIALYRWRRQGQSADLVHRQDAAQAAAAVQRRAEEHVAAMQFGPAALLYRKLFDEHRPVLEMTPRRALQHLVAVARRRHQHDELEEQVGRNEDGTGQAGQGAEPEAGNGSGESG